MNNKKFQRSVMNHDKFPRSMTEAFGSGIYHMFDEKKNNRKSPWIISLIIIVALMILMVVAQI